VVEPISVEAPASLWRVGRVSDPVHFSEIDPVDAAVANGGNRFDVPGGEVLYAATAPGGAYAETIARLRPSAKMRALEPDDGHMLAGGVPADWRWRRALVQVSLDQPLPFLDVEATETHTFLTEAIPHVLLQHGVENLDVADVRGPNRLLTRDIARYAYVAQDDEGHLAYSGIRYVSKVGQHECWAIFGGVSVSLVRTLPVDKHDPDLGRVASAFGLIVH